MRYHCLVRMCVPIFPSYVPGFRLLTAELTYLKQPMRYHYLVGLCVLIFPSYVPGFRLLTAELTYLKKSMRYHCLVRMCVPRFPSYVPGFRLLTAVLTSLTVNALPLSSENVRTQISLMCTRIQVINSRTDILSSQCVIIV